jgi:hypothetical protein
MCHCLVSGGHLLWVIVWVIMVIWYELLCVVWWEIVLCYCIVDGENFLWVNMW